MSCNRVAGLILPPVLCLFSPQCSVVQRMVAQALQVLRSMQHITHAMYKKAATRADAPP
jgi:hypothetical protein